ncbi:MAG: class I SAM-dependent methyltransferase [Acidimicrobiales bacterium]
MSEWTAGDFDYDRLGAGYTHVRRPDPRIADQIHDALGDARTVLNVGAGAGSYEPRDRLVAAVEPSATMRAQRPLDLPPAIDAIAQQLPFDDDAFDASMTVLSVHHWPDPDAGLREMRRVTTGPVVVFTFDGDALADFWLDDYAPELIAVERRRYPALSRIVDALGGECVVRPVEIPFDCTDGFGDAFYGRPEAFLDPAVRAAQSAWGFVEPDAEARAVTRLQADLDAGEWDRRHGHLRNQPSYAGAVRLVISSPEP